MATTYAIINKKLDNSNSIVALRDKGIKDDRNFCDIISLAELIEKVQAHDKVLVISIDRFGSVGMFYQFYLYMRRKGVSFQSINESFLSFKDGKELKSNIVNYIIEMEKVEKAMTSSLYSYYKHIVRDKYVAELVKAYTMRVVLLTFDKEGILARKS